jgi:hypothetical protein
MTNETTLAFIWNEAEELSCSLRELTDDELIDCRKALLDRAKAIMEMALEIEL